MRLSLYSVSKLNVLSLERIEKMLTFKGGIHPPDQKGTGGKAIKVVFPKPQSEMIYPCVQHIGAPCEPIVSVGDRVLIGQKIAEAKAFVCSPIHASVSGTVKAIRPNLTPLGISTNSIVLENDGEFEELEMSGIVDHKKLKKEEILTLIKEAGIVGLGGAGFPTHVKLNPPPEKKIDTILINASECEPYLTTDHRVLLEESEKLVVGLQIMLQLHPGAKGIIGIEANKLDAIEAMKKVAQNTPEISIVSLKPKYPQGCEKQLITACTDREVPSGKLPADIGCIVNNVDTVIAIHRAVKRGRPLMRKIVTIAGGCVKNPGNYKVRLGMTIAEFIEVVGGLKEEPYKIIVGGPMMGVAIFDLNVPIIKTTSAILCFNEKEGILPAEKNCIRCGRCVSHCPIGLMPLELNRNVLDGDMDQFKANNGLDCIECGSCSYICPSKRHLAQSIRSTRRKLMEARK